MRQGLRPLPAMGRARINLRRSTPCTGPEPRAVHHSVQRRRYAEAWLTMKTSWWVGAPHV